MSAQKELAELLNTPVDDRDWASCADFVYDHGPAIAELIEACGEYLASKGYSCTRERMLVAYEKLTEPKA